MLLEKAHKELEQHENCKAGSPSFVKFRDDISEESVIHNQKNKSNKAHCLTVHDEIDLEHTGDIR
jgi:hypothetical protein